MNGILLRYLPSMLRDYLMTRGGAMLVLGLVFVLPLLIGFNSFAELPPSARAQARQVLTAVAPVLALVGAYGLIGQDFRLSYYRALFSKPISVPLYYAILFGCSVLTFWLVQSLLVGIFVWYGVNPFEPALALDVTMRFVLLASMIFALSRLTRLDWLFAFFVYNVAGPLRSTFPADEYLRGRIIDVLAPPSHLLQLTPSMRAVGQITPLVSESGSVVWGSIAWVAGYALACFVIAMVLVRRVPLANAG